MLNCSVASPKSYSAERMFVNDHQSVDSPKSIGKREMISTHRGERDDRTERENELDGSRPVDELG